MRVRHLQHYLQREELLVHDSLDSLASLRVGVDAAHWLRSIPSLKDPLSGPIGGIPPGLFGYIDRELEWFTTHNVTPFFVFPGMDAGIRAPAMVANLESQGQQLELAWTHLRRGSLRQAERFFALATSRVTEDMLSFIFHHLRLRRHEVLQAPHHSGAQLAMLLRAGFVDCVYGPPGLVVHECAEVVVDVCWQTSSLARVSRERLLEHSQLTKDQFFDACLMAGTGDCATHPLIGGTRDDAAQGERGLFAKAVQSIKEAPFDVWVQRLEAPECQQACADVHASAKALLRWVPVALPGSLEVLPLELAVASASLRAGEPAPSQSDAPGNLALMTGDKLPGELYFLMASGFVSTRLVQALARGEWLDKAPPLVDTAEYRVLLQDLEDYRARALGVLASRMGDSFLNKNITMRVWWEPARDLDNIFSPDEKVLVPFCLPGCVPWRITPEAVQAELRRQGERRVSLRFCLQWHDHECRTNGQLVEDFVSPEDPPLDHSALSLAALVHFQLLEQLELIIDGNPTCISYALKDAPSQFVEPALLAMELMKHGVLCADPFIPGDDARPFPVQVGYQAPPGDPDVRSRLLLSRAMSLVPMKLRRRMWSAPVDFDLAAFQSIVGLLTRTLSHMAQASLCSLLMEDMARAELVSPGGYTPAPAQGGLGAPGILPLSSPPRACMGVVVLFFLDYDPDAPGSFAENLEAAFPCCHSPLADLKNAMLFWEELRRIMLTIDSFGDMETAEMVEHFQNADVLLQQQQVLLRVFPDGPPGGAPPRRRAARQHHMDQPESEPPYRQMFDEN